MDLSRLANESLTRLVANCIFEVATRGPREARARTTLTAAYPEIERRVTGRDETGLLAVLGYHVNHREPLPEERRRAVLA